MCSEMRGIKINSDPGDLLTNGQHIIIIGELSHKDIDVKMYLYILSTKDSHGTFISETKVKILDNDNIELSEELRRNILTLKIRFKENLIIYGYTEE